MEGVIAWRRLDVPRNASQSESISDTCSFDGRVGFSSALGCGFGALQQQ